MSDINKRCQRSRDTSASLITIFLSSEGGRWAGCHQSGFSRNGTRYTRKIVEKCRFDFKRLIFLKNQNVLSSSFDSSFYHHHDAKDQEAQGISWPKSSASPPQLANKFDGIWTTENKNDNSRYILVQDGTQHGSFALIGYFGPTKTEHDQYCLLLANFEMFHIQLQSYREFLLEQ